MPDATQTRLIMPTKPRSPVGRIRRSRRIRRLSIGARCAATRLIMPTKPPLTRRPDKAFTPHPAVVIGARCAATRLIMPTKPHSPVGRIRRSRRIRRFVHRCQMRRYASYHADKTALTRRPDKGVHAASGGCAPMPDATPRVLSCRQTACSPVGRIRRSRRIRQYHRCRMPTSTPPLSSTPAHPALRYTTAHAAPVQTTLRSAPSKGRSCGGSSSTGSFPAAFICSFTCGIVI